MDVGRKLLAAGRPSEARPVFESVREAALQSRNYEAGLAADRVLIFLSRSEGDWPRTEELLREAIELAERGDRPAEVPALYSELGAARRALGRPADAVASLQHAVKLREKSGAITAELARDWTTLGLIHLENKDTESAKLSLTAAVFQWTSLLREDPEVLGALEALAGIYREVPDYEKAGPLYLRALRIREINFGPSSAEVIGALDNLAWVYFGEKRFAEAEPLYRRLLAVWETNAGPDHPMVAVTLDKLVTFYLAQERYPEAEELTSRALESRAKAYLANLRVRSRVAALRGDNPAAIDFATKASAFIDLAGLPKPEVKILPAPKNAKPVVPSRKLLPNPK